MARSPWPRRRAKDALPFDLETGDPANPAGPFPNAFDANSKLERFTSDGPRRVFFEADGTPITPGNFGSTGGEVRQKPDITAADGVRPASTGFDPFFGTSAAAPHAAAIAGLVLSGNPGIDPAEVREALISTAIDIGAPGVDAAAGTAWSSRTGCSATRAPARSRSRSRRRRRWPPTTVARSSTRVTRRRCRCR